MYKLKNNYNNYFYYDLEKKFIGYKAIQKSQNNDSQYEVSNTLKGVKLTKEYGTDNIIIKSKNGTFVTEQLAHLEKNSKLNFFKDKESGDYFVLCDGHTSGPYKNLFAGRMDSVDKETAYKGHLNTDANFLYVVDAEDKILKIGEDLTVRDVQKKYISENVIQNTNDKEFGKFAWCSSVDDLENLNNYIFDHANITMVDNIWQNKIFKNTETKEHYIVTKEDNKVIALPEMGEFRRLDTNKDFLFASFENGTVVIDSETNEIIYKCDKVLNNVMHDNKAFVINFSDNTSTYIYKNKNYNMQTYKFECLRATTELPYHAQSIKNDCIMVQNSDGKCGIVDSNGNIVLDFDYDAQGYVDNRTEIFMPIRQNGKMGLFNTQTKKVEIEPFCESFLLDEFENHGWGKVGDDLYRFFFKGENGKYGVVNNKGHIIIEPVLKKSSAYSLFSNDKNDYRECEYKNKELYVSLTKPEVFPTTPKIVYSHSTKSNTTTHTRNKYSDSDILTGVIAGGVLFGTVGAIGAYNIMSSQKESYETTETSTSVSSTEEKHFVPKSILPYVHMDTADLPKELTGEIENIPDTLTIAQYQKKIEEAKLAKTENENLDKEDEELLYF